MDLEVERECKNIFLSWFVFLLILIAHKRMKYSKFTVLSWLTKASFISHSTNIMGGRNSNGESSTLSVS